MISEPKARMKALLIIGLMTLSSLYVLSPEPNAPKGPQDFTFNPANPTQPFLWGVATASVQVEGNTTNSDWNYFADQSIQQCPSVTLAFPFYCGIADRVRANLQKGGYTDELEVNLKRPGDAVNEWQPEIYLRDFDYAKLLGLNSFRLSLEWSRIEPTAPVMVNGVLQHQWNMTAINHYREMLQALIQRGITPVLTVNHMSLPRWVMTPPALTVCAVFCFTVTNAIATDGSIVPDVGYQGSLRGWENPETVNLFGNFTQKVVQEFKGLVDYWVTVNEPVASMVGAGYIAGLWSPGFTAEPSAFPGADRASIVLHNVIMAHVRAYNVIHQFDDQHNPLDNFNAMVGFAHAMPFAQPANPMTISLPTGDITLGDNTEASLNYDYFTNAYFLNAVVKGEEDLNYLKTLQRHNTASPDFIIHDDWKNKTDFIGVNYYRRDYVASNLLLNAMKQSYVGGQPVVPLFGKEVRSTSIIPVPVPLGLGVCLPPPFPDGLCFLPVPVTSQQPHGLLYDMGVEIYPQGLYNQLIRIKTEWNKPILITENGFSEKNEKLRAPYIVAHLRQIMRAMADGADVIGYLHWSLMDNWEWHAGYTPESQFGLFHISTHDSDGRPIPPFHRAITQGAFAYQQIISDSGGGPPTAAAIANAEEKFGSISDDGMSVTTPTRTHGRFWEGMTSDGTGLTLYLGHTLVSPGWIGMIYWHDNQTWRRADNIRWSGTMLMFTENWFDPVSGLPRHRDHQVAFVGNDLKGSFTQDDGTNRSWNATRIPGVGLWKWSGASPWGGALFYISKFEGSYAGKFFTFSRIPSWKDLRSVEIVDSLLHLDGEPLVDLYLTLSQSTVSTVSRNSGTWTGSKFPLVCLGLDCPIGYTGFSAPLGSTKWSGDVVDASPHTFDFVENHPFFRAFYTGRPDLYYRIRDPFSVVPLASFNFEILSQVCVIVCVVTDARVSFEAGGRSYVTETGIGVCLAPLSCTGTWTDIAGFLANRLPEETPFLQVSKFFTDSSLNPLATDANGNPKVDIVLAQGKVKSTNPGQVLAWINVTNTGAQAMSLTLKETLPTDWSIDPPWLPALGAIHAFFQFANGTQIEITNQTGITTTTGNPQTVTLTIPNISATASGKGLDAGESILLSIKITYSLKGTTQSIASYPRNYMDTAAATAWTQETYTGTQVSGSASAFFVAYAKS